MNIEILRQFINGNHTSGYFDAGFLTFNYEVVDVWERSAGGRVFFKYNIDRNSSYFVEGSLHDNLHSVLVLFSLEYLEIGEIKHIGNEY